MEKNNSHSICPSNAQSKNSMANFTGNQSCASITKHGEKTCIAGDSHIWIIKKKLLDNSINESKAHLNSFSGGIINKLDHFITSILEENRPDIKIIHVGSNDIKHNTISNIDAKSISKRIIDIGRSVYCSMV